MAGLVEGLGTVAKAKGGISKLARDTGLSRENLSRSLSPGGNHRLDTVFKVAAALGLCLNVAVLSAEAWPGIPSGETAMAIS